MGARSAAASGANDRSVVWPRGVATRDDKHGTCVAKNDGIGGRDDLFLRKKYF